MRENVVSDLFFFGWYFIFLCKDWGEIVLILRLVFIKIFFLNIENVFHEMFHCSKVVLVKGDLFIKNLIKLLLSDREQ